jgi:hypothetical protein
MAQNAYKRMKMLRHPEVLRFADGNMVWTELGNFSFYPLRLTQLVIGQCNRQTPRCTS